MAEKSPATSSLENAFAQWLTFRNVSYIKQYQAIKDRRYRCDFYLPKYKVIIEIEGGQWIQGRHQRGTGYRQDIEKYNLLVLSGYKVLRLTTDHFVRTGLKSYTVGRYSAKLVDMLAEAYDNDN